MNIISILSAVIICAVVAVLLREYKSEFGIAFTIGVSAVILLLALFQMEPVFSEVSNLAESAGVESEYIVILLKALGICYLTEFAADICKDAGESSLASKAALCGKIGVLILSLPLIKTILEVAKNILEG